VYGVIDRRAAELAAAPGPPQARPQGGRRCHCQSRPRPKAAEDEQKQEA